MVTTISLNEITDDNSVHFSVKSFGANPISSTMDPLCSPSDSETDGVSTKA
jgi:hypothetical protein